tara:strand:+ start:165 stop:374 length:210 start_codon:yes stop_codon:yes gene_type:complete
MTFILHDKKLGKSGKVVCKVEKDKEIYWINSTNTATDAEIEKKLDDILTEQAAEEVRLAEIEALVKANT